MADKVQKIREEVEIVVNRRLNLLNGDYFNLNEETDGLTNEIMYIIDSLREEPKKCMYSKDNFTDKDRKVLCDGCKEKCEYSKKEHLWKPADGDDLPEIDREVIAILDNGKVVFAHRPPEYWDGKDIITGKVTRNYPKTYDRGGWNIPNIVLWLDVELPKEIEL